MIGTAIHFSSEFQALHDNAMSSLSERYGHEILPIYLQRPKIRTIQDCIDEINQKLRPTLFMSPQQIKEKRIAENNGDKAFYSGLHSDLEAIRNLCIELHAQIVPVSPDSDFYISAGYIYLLLSILNYNCFVYAERAGKVDFFSLTEGWFSVYETKVYPLLGHNQLDKLCALVANRIRDYKRPETGRWTTSQELENALLARNKRSLNALPIDIIIDESCFFISEFSKSALLELSESIFGSKNIPLERKQIIFYPNHEHGPVEVLDVHYDDNLNMFKIILVSSSHHELLHGLLKYITTDLNAHDVQFEVTVCYTAELTKGKFPAENAYILSAELARQSYAHFRNVVFRTMPPFVQLLMNLTEEELAILPVDWFHFSAFSDKALLLAAKNESASDLFKQRHGPDSNLYEIFRKKYNIADTKLFPDCHANFSSYVRAKLQLHEKPNLTLMELVHELNDDFTLAQVESVARGLSKPKKPRKIKNYTIEVNFASLSLRADDSFIEECAQALHRAMAGYCTAEKFDALLSFLSLRSNQEKDAILNTFDDEKEYTPMHIAIQGGRARRAKQLHEAGAKLTLANNQGSTAQQMLDATPSDSIFRKYFKLSS